MNKVIGFLIIVTFIFISSCSKSQDKLIVGKWRLSDIDVATSTSAKDLSPNEKAKREQMKVVLRKMTMEYMADNTFKANLPEELNQSSKGGTYKLEEEGKFIVIELAGPDGEKRSERSEIKKLTEDSLILKSEKGGTAFFVKE